MASYGNTVLTSAGIDLVKRVIAKTATFEITKVATSSDSRLTNATISAIEAMTSLPSVNQTGKVTAFDTSNSRQVGLKCEFTNQGLTNPYNICGVGIYAKEAGKNEILFAVAPAKEPETMPAKPNDQSALFSFSLNMYVVVGQASAMSITATTEGVIKSINGTIKPDANGNVTVSYYSQAEVDQKISSLSSRIDSLNSSKTNNTDFNALKDRVAANESGKADKTSVYDKGTADGRYLQRDASTTLKSGSVLRWDDSDHANDGNNVPYTAGGLKWSGKTDSAEIRAEETGVDNLDLVFNLGDDGSNNVDFRWNNVSKAKINSSGKFTGHVDWANVDGKDTYSRLEIDSKINTAISEASARSDQAQNNVNALSSKVTNMQDDVASVKATVSNIRVGDRNLARGVASSKDWAVFQGFDGSINYNYELINYSLDTLKAGDTVTFGITMKNDGVTSGTMIFMQFGDVSQWNRDFSGISSPGNVTDFVPNGAEKSLTYTITITDGMLNGNNSYTIYIRTDGVLEGGKLSFRYAFVKKGTMATDWTPAPEDLEDRFVNASGDSMSGNLVLDSSHHLEHLGGVVNFSKRFEDQSSINSLINALRPLTGCSGSFELTAQDGALNTGWYNFIWMPHREGGITGGDNGEYGTMLLVPFGGGSAWIANFNNGETSIRALAWDSNLAATTNTANAAKAKAEANANRITDAANAISSLDSKMTRLMPQAAYVPVQVGDKTDLNNMKTCGFYLLQGGTSNSPVDGWTYVTVQGISTRLTQFVWQDIDPAQQWCRFYDGSNWTTWTHYTKAL